MDASILQVMFWVGISLISFGVISYLVFTCPEYEEMEDGTLIRKE